MGKKEKVFPNYTIGGRIYELRNKLGFCGSSGRVDFYNFLYDNESISKESKQKNVYNWECSEDSIPIPVLKKICEKCNCSSDYLLGIEKEVNHDIHFICNSTGLSEDAVETLIRQKDVCFSVADTINFLLEKDDYIGIKMELFYLIINYVLLSQSIKSYEECGVSRMKNDNIILCDEYGKPVGNVRTDNMASIFLLSINNILSKLRDSISIEQMKKKPTVFDILCSMLFDIIRIDDIRKNIDKFNFDIDNLSRMNRRFSENKKRLIYIYGCDNINDIDFEKFKTEHPEYSEYDIQLLKSELNL